MGTCLMNDSSLIDFSHVYCLYDCATGGYPPCGVPLLQNFDVDMERFSGNISGVTDQNIQLFDEWGTMVCASRLDICTFLIHCMLMYNVELVE